MQNHGFLQAINGLVSGAMLYKMPLLLLISDRGHFGERDPWQTEGGKVTRRMLDALGIVYDEVHAPDEVEGMIAKAMTLADSSSSPVALLLTRDLMWED
jgi:sulfopyruvate decarboxylase subunit alpha